MKTENGIPMNNPAVAALPKHLLQFAVDQRYDEYTSVDHAVWRFIMRQNIFFLKEYAHKVYFQGLLDTGISFDRIPRIQEMNDILAKIGWGAVAVDGFGFVDLVEMLGECAAVHVQVRADALGCVAFE